MRELAPQSRQLLEDATRERPVGRWAVAHLDHGHLVAWAREQPASSRRRSGSTRWSAVPETRPARPAPGAGRGVRRLRLDDHGSDDHRLHDRDHRRDARPRSPPPRRRARTSAATVSSISGNDVSGIGGGSGTGRKRPRRRPGRGRRDDDGVLGRSRRLRLGPLGEVDPPLLSRGDERRLVVGRG